jgi:hypothetical protein
MNICPQSARPATLALHCRNGIHQFKSLSHLVGVSASQPCDQRDPLSVGYDMMLAASLFVGSGASNGSTSSHSSSDTRGLALGFPHSLVSLILKLVKWFC